MFNLLFLGTVYLQLANSNANKIHCKSIEVSNSLHLACSSNSCISEILHATFGYHTVTVTIDPSSCTSEPQPPPPEHCTSPNTLNVVQSLCFNRTSCDIYAHDIVFGGGIESFKCHHQSSSSKSLRVTFSCAPCPSSSTSTSTSTSTIGLGTDYTTDTFNLFCEDESIHVTNWSPPEILTCEQFLSKTDFTCLDYFCPTCVGKNLCDRTCGYCASSCNSVMPPPPPDLSLDETDCREKGGILDCENKCLLKVHCEFKPLLYSECQDWIANGSCDDGRGYVTDAGIKPNFNCAKFNFDGNDCESSGSSSSSSSSTSSSSSYCRNLPFSKAGGDLLTCSEVLGSGRMTCTEDFCDTCEFAGACDLSCEMECNRYSDLDSDSDSHPIVNLNANSHWCILLTSAITPSQSMSNTKRWSPNLRRREYERSINLWVQEFDAYSTKYPAGPLPSIVMVESSGASLSSFRKLVPKRWESKFEFVSFHNNHSAPTLGKGFAEFESMKYAVENSKIMSSGDTGGCSHVVKITGRYCVKDMIGILSTFKEDVDLVLQSR